MHLGQEDAAVWPEVPTFSRSCVEFPETPATLLDGDTGSPPPECILAALVALSLIKATLASNAHAAWPACHLAYF